MAANGPCVVCGKPCGWGVAMSGHRMDFYTTFPVDGQRQFMHKACKKPDGAVGGARKSQQEGDAR